MAESLLATARSGFELYAQWYKSQQAKRKRKRVTSTICDIDDNGIPAVCLDSSDENDETQSSSSAGRTQTKRPRLLQDVKVPMQHFPVGTTVQKVGFKKQ